MASWNGLARTSSRQGFVVLATGLLSIFGSTAIKGDEVEHLDQEELVGLVEQGSPHEAFELAFEHGDELFETAFTADDGVGVYVGNGALFSRVPRADLDGPEEWATHTPPRITGPNAVACNSCHNKPADDGAGGIAVNVVRDPLRTGNIADYIERNTPHLFGAGAVQRLAEEMTQELRQIRNEAQEVACRRGGPAGLPLHAKRIEFGAIIAVPTQLQPCRVTFDNSQVEGVDPDLVIRPFRWKGADLTLRAFVREAANNELGMQADELVGRGVDGDHDGVVDELTVGDITALEVYISAQPRPVTKVELAEHGQIEPLPPEQRRAIRRGAKLFEDIGCDLCHRPTLTIDHPTFSAPSQSAFYRDEVFPGGEDPLAEGVDPTRAVTHDLTLDLPDNIIVEPDGDEVRLGVFAPGRGGGAVVPLYGDLKRHDMGPELADAIDETETGSSVWMTRSLWGAGSTDPYLHDGRATTLDEAIRAHGGEAAATRDAYLALGEQGRAAVIAFLDDLTLFRMAED